MGAKDLFEIRARERFIDETGREIGYPAEEGMAGYLVPPEQQSDFKSGVTMRVSIALGLGLSSFSGEFHLPVDDPRYKEICKASADAAAETIRDIRRLPFRIVKGY